MGSNNLVIADAGPIIHLDEIGCLWLPSDFPVVYIAETVLLEVTKHRPLALQQSPINWCIITAPHNQKVIALSKIYTLHTGEMESLALCLQYPQALFFTDDTAARLAAKSLNIQAYGTLGILIRAIRCQQMTKLEVIAILKQIPQLSTLHIKPSLLEQVIQQVCAY
jgi:predicted nucleic acid-binding protein